MARSLLPLVRSCFQGVACGWSYVRCRGSRASPEHAAKACPVASLERHARERRFRLAGRQQYPGNQQQGAGAGHSPAPERFDVILHGIRPESARHLFHGAAFAEQGERRYRDVCTGEERQERRGQRFRQGRRQDQGQVRDIGHQIGGRIRRDQGRQDRRRRRSCRRRRCGCRRVDRCDAAHPARSERDCRCRARRAGRSECGCEPGRRCCRLAADDRRSRSCRQCLHCGADRRYQDRYRRRQERQGRGRRGRCRDHDDARRDRDRSERGDRDRCKGQWRTDRCRQPGHAEDLVQGRRNRAGPDRRLEYRPGHRQGERRAGSGDRDGRIRKPQSRKQMAERPRPRQPSPTAPPTRHKARQPRTRMRARKPPSRRRIPARRPLPPCRRR
ncbi:hypothetical protein ABIF91_001297 [Bradyrhizobium sp. USDA 241]